ncbi:MAG: TVP38/TMEM64 family protein [Gammaproteobacteria bacterium]|nr:TVP38/TMEM64 family protein [Gammaproteobacteria bacterium]
MTALKRKLLIAAAGLAIITAFFLLVPDQRGLLFDAAAWAESAPERAWPLFVFCFAIAVIGMFPGWLFMVAGGYLFGAVMGGILSFVANLIGSVAAFYVAKTYARQWIKNRLDHSSKFHGFDRVVSRSGFQTVMFARLALLPNNLINYACGITGMRLRDFVLGTCIGVLPILIANVLIGASAMDLFVALEDGTFEGERPPIMVFVAIVAVVALAVLLAKRFGPRLAGPQADPELSDEEVRPDR